MPSAYRDNTEVTPKLGYSLEVNSRTGQMNPGTRSVFTAKKSNASEYMASTSSITPQTKIGHNK